MYYVLWFVICSDYKSVCSEPRAVQAIFRSEHGCMEEGKDWQGQFGGYRDKILYVHCRSSLADFPHPLKGIREEP
ncbi:hypothetical protein [Pseudomonas fluorescens]|uniref:hypothetical protein n=1 Tax=Pseudomonas fluorescens TaxID=294 RepID=UPI00163962CE|nr:hypothetical protein [Pseudomonas fluorescens]